MSSWLERNKRRLAKADTLLRPALEDAGGTWAELGCGDGIFTYLLGTFLKPGSVIYAMDRDQGKLAALKRNLMRLELEVTVRPHLADFTAPLTLPPLDGLVMANSLHFVGQKEPVLRQVVPLLKPGGRLVVVEYNTNQGNYAVPYPLDEAEFLHLVAKVGLREARIEARAPSTFLGEMYTGVATK